MQYYKLEQNIVDILEEQQLKLGYMSEVVRLYYPLGSLNRFMETDCSIEEMEVQLESFAVSVEERLGRLRISHEKERFCLVIPPEGSDYVHENMRPDSFMADLVRTVGRHGCTLDEVFGQFYRHSEHVHVEKMENGEFDYLVYFEDGVPDCYRYCITVEGGHVIYHRYTTEDYEDFG